jgi:hypothetical protein
MQDGNAATGQIKFIPSYRSLRMPATGELIRSLNYVDDISATLRRIISSISTMTPEERKKLAEALRGTVSNLNDVLSQLEKGAPA